MRQENPSSEPIVTNIPKRRKRRRSRSQQRTNSVRTFEAFVFGVLLVLPYSVVHSSDFPAVGPSLDTAQERPSESVGKKSTGSRPSRRGNSGGTPPQEGPTIPGHTMPSSLTREEESRQHEREFIDWCKQALGIQTNLEIQTFEYFDYMKALPTEDWEDGSDDDDRIPVDLLPMIPVRGLAASRDIQEGEVVIRIPLQALFSVTTTIDQDPVLGPVLGPEARQAYGFDLSSDAATDDDANAQGDETNLLEIPLLAVALLHHKKLGSGSPLFPYIQLLENTPVDTMPFLWSPSRLKAEASEGIRTVARGIKREIENMYTSVVQVLILKHPDLFGPKNDADSEDKWMFSYENFQWAFAIVNSRHWQLPIPDLEEIQYPVVTEKTALNTNTLEDEQLPPADMPTDTWVREHDGGLSEVGAQQANPMAAHSFLAPVADLLNFGPPCTRGVYNKESHTFEIIASCSFRKGQEVTYWYSDECDHIMVGVFGFMHPIVPPCPSAEEYRKDSELWRSRTEALEIKLTQAYQELDLLDSEVLRLQEILNGCDCCRYEKRAASTHRAARREPSVTRLRHEHVRGSSFTDREDIDRHGVRKMRRDRNSEF